MATKTPVVCILLGVSLAGALLVARQSNDEQWTNKNNLEMSAKYLLVTTYEQQGYSDVKVGIERSGDDTIFVVHPGKIYHVKEVVVMGPEGFRQPKALQSTPKPGDVYTPAAVNAWAAALKQECESSNTGFKLASWGATMDHAHGLVSIQATVKR